MEQLYIEALLIHWHTGLKFSSENRNPQIPEIGQKNRSIHPDINLFWISGISHAMPGFQSDLLCKVAYARYMCFILHSTILFIRKLREN